MKNVSDKVVEKINKHFMFKLFSESCAIYEIMWKNMVESDRPRMTIRRMCFACWITKAADTHSEYVNLIAFPWLQWFCKCASMLTFMRKLPVLYVMCTVNSFSEELTETERKLENN
jgi:hypothetical protein